MDQITNRDKNEDFDYSKSISGSLSEERSFNKSLSNLKKQDQFINQFGSTLKKTLDLLSVQSPTTSFKNDLEKENIKLIESSTQRHSKDDPQEFEKENLTLKSMIRNLQRENDNLKIDLSIRNTAGYHSSDKDRSSSFLGDVDDLRSKNASLVQENTEIRKELSKTKMDYAKKCENLK
jgi:hypothetical protein